MRRVDIRDGRQPGTRGMCSRGTAPMKRFRPISVIVLSAACFVALCVVTYVIWSRPGATSVVHPVSETARAPKVEAAATDPPLSTDQTEAFHEAATAQLRKLGDLLKPGKPIDPAALRWIVGDDFYCGPLLPPDQRTVLADRAIKVLRAADPAAAAKRYRGAGGLAVALEAVVSTFEGCERLRVAFKQYRVNPAATTIGTTDMVSIGGLRAGGAVEQHVTWHCRWRRDGGPEAPQLLSIEARGFEQVTVEGPRATIFGDCTEAVVGSNACYQEQLAYGTLHWIDRIEEREGLDFNGYHGITLGDVNGDMLEDVYVPQGGGLPNLLLVQNLDGTVSDVSAERGVDFLDATTSALLVDLDNDGDQDLVVATRGRLLVLANDGRGWFTKRGHIQAAGDAFSVAAADFDLDGDLDLYACRYYPDQRVASSPLPYHDANNGQRNVLLRNEGNWTFSDVTAELGLDVNNRRWSFAASWEDYDNDGDPDLYVANDFGRNCLYRNDRTAGGGFVDAAAEAGVEDVASGMSVTWSDYNHDGLMDVYVSNMFSSAGGRIAFQRSFKPATQGDARSLIQRLARGNSLFENRGDGTFRDMSIESGTTMGRWAWSSNFFDVNNDGWDDLIVANGYVTGPNTGDL